MSDFFHEFARAYYGVSPELYALANIATNGAAPEDYACTSGFPQQYTGYVKPELPDLPKQHESLPGQKGLFADVDVSPTEQKLSPRALYKQHLMSNGAKEVEPGVFELPRNRGLAFIQKMNAIGLRPDQQMGTKEGNWKFVLYPNADKEDNPDNWPVNPMDATAEQIEDDHEAIRRSADEEDYGIMDAAKTPPSDVPYMTGDVPAHPDAPEYLKLQPGEKLQWRASKDFPKISRLRMKAEIATKNGQHELATKLHGQLASYLESQAKSLDQQYESNPNANFEAGNKARLARSLAESARRRVEFHNSKLQQPTPKIDYALTGTGTRVECAKNRLPSTEAKAGGVTPAKAKTILEDGEVRGHPLTEAQKGMFGAIAGAKK